MSNTPRPVPVLIDNSEQRKKTRAQKRRRRMAGLLLLLLALFLIIFRKDIDLYRLRLALQGGLTAEERFEVADDTSGDLAIAGMDDCLVLLTERTFSLYRADGSRRYHADLAVASPALVTNDHYALAFDLGGTTASLVRGGSRTCTITTESPILAADVAENGTFALVLTPDDALATVEVYSRAGELRYRFVSSSSYISAVALSDDGREAAIGGFAVEQAAFRGVLRFLDLTKEEPVAEISLPDELILGMRQSGGHLTVVTDTGLHGYSLTGELQHSAGYGENRLLYFAIEPDGSAGLLLGRYTVGHDTTLCRYTAKGELQFETALTGDVRGLTGGHGMLLVLQSGTVTLFDEGGRAIATEQASSVRGGAVLSGGRAALVGDVDVTLLS
ncbi:MAG: hypothetical protein IJC43_08840 [Clostridia bacterium]|nr:hypothetical protein [Clostridia bacterium]